MAELRRRGVLAALGTGVLGSSLGSAQTDVENRNVDDQTSDERVDVAAVYIPFVGSWWDDCATDAHQPALGRYEMAQGEVVNRHVAWMREYGISTAMFNWSVMDDDEYFQNFIAAERSSEVELEMFYQIGNALKWRGDRTVKEQIDRHAEYIREEFFSRENLRSREGRPVVSCWDVDSLAWGGNEVMADVKEGILDQWGSFDAFVEYFRSKLTVDGTEPYLIGDFHDHAIGGYPVEYAELNAQFDAAMNWTGKLRDGETVPWDEAYEYVKETYEATRRFTDEHGMDFVPTVFPGFDDRPNTCWESERHVPRDPDHLADLLELADEYRTVDRINLATFNGWPEGHHVEPGTFDGRDYGTAYLNVIEEFVNRPEETTTTKSSSGSTTTTQLTSPTSTSPTSDEVRTTYASTDDTTDTSESVSGMGLGTALGGLGLGAYRCLCKENSK